MRVQIPTADEIMSQAAELGMTPVEYAQILSRPDSLSRFLGDGETVPLSVPRTSMSEPVDGTQYIMAESVVDVMGNFSCESYASKIFTLAKAKECIATSHTVELQTVPEEEEMIIIPLSQALQMPEHREALKLNSNDFDYLKLEEEWEDNYIADIQFGDASSEIEVSDADPALSSLELDKSNNN